MDRRSDYVQRFLAQRDAQNRLFEILKPHRRLITGFEIGEEEQGGRYDLQRLPNNPKEAPHAAG